MKQLFFFVLTCYQPQALHNVDTFSSNLEGFQDIEGHVFVHSNYNHLSLKNGKHHLNCYLEVNIFQTVPL